VREGVMKRLMGSALAIVALSLNAAPISAAEAYPTRPIRLIIPFGPGASNDIVARIIAPRMSEGLGQAVVVDNRTGAGGIVAAELVAQAQPDGHTALMGSPGPLVVNPLLMPKLSYNPQRDFAPVTLVSIVPGVLVVHPAMPVKSVSELVALARGKPGQLNYASTGQGSVPHLSGELFKMLAKVDLVHVPYKGSAAAIADLLGGQINVFFDNVASALPFVKSGKLRGLAITTAKRSDQLPNLPTMIEAGVAGYESNSWNGIVMPAKTPKAVIDRFYAELVKALQVPDVRDRIAGVGAEVSGIAPTEFTKFMQRETQKWGRVVKEAGIKAE
jgi:tripartite-type tricarboxylate transporter receptor subunit TctC